MEGNRQSRASVCMVQKTCLESFLHDYLLFLKGSCSCPAVLPHLSVGDIRVPRRKAYSACVAELLLASRPLHRAV